MDDVEDEVLGPAAEVAETAEQISGYTTAVACPEASEENVQRAAAAKALSESHQPADVLNDGRLSDELEDAAPSLMSASGTEDIIGVLKAGDGSGRSEDSGTTDGSVQGGGLGIAEMPSDVTGTSKTSDAAPLVSTLTQDSGQLEEQVGMELSTEGEGRMWSGRRQRSVSTGSEASVVDGAMATGYDTVNPSKDKTGPPVRTTMIPPTIRVSGRKKIANTSQNDRPTPVNVISSAISQPSSRSRTANPQQTTEHSELDVTARKATKPQVPPTGGGRQRKV